MGEKTRNTIRSQSNLKNYAKRIKAGEQFVCEIVFDSPELLYAFLTEIDVDISEFSKKHFYYSENKELHIAESETGVFWISTMGIVSREKIFNNSFLNALESQYWVMDTLINGVLELLQDERVYDVNSYQFGQINRADLAIYHNMVFYMELVAKSYLSICGVNFKYIHDMDKLVELVEKTMIDKGHDNTLFQAVVFSNLQGMQTYIKNIPSGVNGKKFKESFIKYDNNIMDRTTISMSKKGMSDCKYIIEECKNIVEDLYDDPDNSRYFDPDYLKLRT